MLLLIYCLCRERDGETGKMVDPWHSDPCPQVANTVQFQLRVYKRRLLLWPLPVLWLLHSGPLDVTRHHLDLSRQARSHLCKHAVYTHD